MNVWNGIERYPADSGPVVASIGNYDGVHLGHRAILGGVVQEAARQALRSLLITFDPHPLEIVAPERRPPLLQTRRQKLLELESTGLDEVLLLEFTPALAELDGERFFREVLLTALRFAAIHVGGNFRFGRDRSGDDVLLARIGAEQGFAVRMVDAVRVDGDVVSSSAIRAAVASGDVERARRLLGRPFAIEGEVVRGEGRGSRMQFPTANVDVVNELVPAPGVYITETSTRSGRFPSVTNVGVRPTFGGRTLTVESHLIDFEGDLYLHRVESRFLARLRDEMRFPTPAQLADQIARDRAAAESYFQNLLIEPR